MLQDEIESFDPAKKTCMIVEDVEFNRDMLEAYLGEVYNVIQAENGLVGLEKLGKYYNELAFILLDMRMPVCDGPEFLRRKAADSRYDDIPVIMATGSEEHDDEVACLALGANDFVNKPYEFDIILNRVANTIRLRESASMVNLLTWDSVTGLYSAEFFYRRVEDLFKEKPDTKFDIVCSDIDSFKSLNERYGRQNCDQLLHDLAERLSDKLPGFVAGGRIGADTYAFVIEHQEENFDELLKSMSENLFAATPSIKYGIVSDIDRDLAVSLSCDHAIIALEKIKGTVGSDVAHYDEEMRQQQLKEQLLLESVDKALEEGQFTVYYQPKINVQENVVGGAEALARWIHPEYGFVSPGMFVPLFEQNGLVSKLDFFIWEESCKQIKRNEELGLPRFPISINASRLDFDLPDLAQRITELADKYGVDHDMLHVEVTETAYSEEPRAVAKVLAELQENGFLIELDDFGSGYSSLASLNILPLNVMKLDMSMVQQASEMNDFRIIQSTIQLANLLDLKTVVEGVETESEVEKLKELGCNLIQGYYYSRPLNQADFEEYVANY